MMKKFVFAACAVLSLTMCVRAVIETRGFAAAAKGAEAAVVSKDRKIGKPQLAFTAQSGERVSFEGSGRDFSRLVLGGKINVLYAPDNTADVRPDSFSVLWRDAIEYGLLALACLVWAWMAGGSRRESANEVGLSMSAD